ncbi:MAG: STAS/SEC14 domain-containing protein [Amphritea sp.]
MIEQLQTDSPKIIGFRFSGKMHDEDYKTFVPTMEDAMEAEGKLSLFAHMEDFHGWDLNAAWDDIKFGAKHYSDFERIAMVGDRNWEEWMAKLSTPFTKATVKYFDKSEIDNAWSWLREDTKQPNAQ